MPLHVKSLVNLCRDQADLSDEEPCLFHIVVAALLESQAHAPGLVIYAVLAWGTVNLLGLTTQTNADDGSRPFQLYSFA